MMFNNKNMLKMLSTSESSSDITNTQAPSGLLCFHLPVNLALTEKL